MWVLGQGAQPPEALWMRRALPPQRWPQLATKLTIRIPQSLNDQMKRDALDQKTTARCIILKGRHTVMTASRMPARPLQTVPLQSLPLEPSCWSGMLDYPIVARCPRNS